MLNRRRVYGGVSIPLPYDAEVEYLQTDGAAYIDTGVKVSSDITFDISIYIPDVVIDFCIFGARVTSSSGQMLYINNAKTWNRKEWWFAGQRVVNASKLAYNNVYNFKNTESKNVLKISNGSTLTANDATFTTDNNFYLLTINNNGTPMTNNIAAGARILPSKIYENGIMVRDYICVRKDGVGYLYDKVNQTFTGNANTTGAFTYGADK